MENKEEIESLKRKLASLEGNQNQAGEKDYQNNVVRSNNLDYSRARHAINRLLWTVLAGIILIVILIIILAVVVTMTTTNQTDFYSYTTSNTDMIIDIMILLLVAAGGILAIIFIIFGILAAIECNKVDCSVGLIAGILCAIPLGITQLIGLILCFVAKSSLHNDW